MKANPVCPECKDPIDAAIAYKVLGRKYQADEPKKSDLINTDKELERWLKENDCKECQNCGNFIERAEGCAALMCLCGSRFCWECEVAYDHGDKCDCDHDCFFDNVLMDDSEDIPKLATSDDLENMKIYLHGRREEEIEKVEDAEGVFDCSILDYEEAEPRRIGSILDNEREAIYLPELQADSDSDSSDTVSADGGETGLCPTVGQNVCASWGALLRAKTV